MTCVRRVTSRRVALRTDERRSPSERRAAPGGALSPIPSAKQISITARLLMPRSHQVRCVAGQVQWTLLCYTSGCYVPTQVNGCCIPVQGNGRLGLAHASHWTLRGVGAVFPVTTWRTLTCRNEGRCTCSVPASSFVVAGSGQIDLPTYT